MSSRSGSTTFAELHFFQISEVDCLFRVLVVKGNGVGIAIVIYSVTIGNDINIDTFAPFFGLSNEFLWNLGLVE